MAYDTVAGRQTVEKVIANLKERNIEAELVDTKEAALARLKDLIPQGASVMTGSSTTLNEIGFTDFLKSGTHGWNNLKEPIAAEKDAAKQAALRNQAIFAEYYLGSVHAVAENGELLIASASGSQLPPYAFTAKNVIWAIGTQKIVPNRDEAMKRLESYVFPLEDARMKSTGAAGSVIAKILLFEREPSWSARKLHVLFINEKLGF